jgi:hypothetical protein
MIIFQKISLLYLFIFLSFISYAQKSISKLDKETKEVISAIFPKMKLKVNEIVAQLDSIDYENISNWDISAGEDYQDYGDSIKNIVKKILADNKTSLITHSNQIKWQSFSIPSKFKLLQEPDYQQEANKQLRPIEYKYTKICAISNVVFAKDFEKALIKIDYSQSNLSSNSCECDYIICQKIKGKWVLVGGMGRNCVFE